MQGRIVVCAVFCVMGLYHERKWMWLWTGANFVSGEKVICRVKAITICFWRMLRFSLNARSICMPHVWKKSYWSRNYCLFFRMCWIAIFMERSWRWSDDVYYLKKTPVLLCTTFQGSKRSALFSWALDGS